MAEKDDQPKSKEVNEKIADDELESLLDSALGDFSQPSPSAQPVTSNQNDKSSLSLEEKDAEAIWNDFMKKAMVIDSSLQSGAGQSGSSSENYRVDFQKMAEAAAKALEEDSGGNDEFSAAIAQTLKNLSENTENLQNQFGSTDEIANMFESLGLNATDSVGQPPQFFPFFQQFMQTFLSKEVLYPSMKELLDKYPAWLEENKDKIPQSDYTRFKKQQKIMTVVCSEFELESETDSEEVAERRFKKIMELMQKMQACGQPPSELMGNMAMSVDGNGMPNLPAGFESPDQCSIG